MSLGCLAFGSEFLSLDLSEFSNSKNRYVSVKFLHRVIEYRTSDLILLISHPFSLLSLDHVVLICLESLLLV